jgi:archaellum component FlaC
MGTRHWPEDANDEVERLEKEIERLRKEVAALTIPGEVRVDPDYFQKLRKIEEAARNLLAVKGRHHTEQAYQRLEDALK